jgi:8-oxo-dGTP pyrophosphatase MutT (NUDIX family)
VNDGNGWARCSLGHRHWGRFGAAGLLVTDGTAVLLQHRAPWTHEGGTWAVPGGARDSHERPLTAALREAAEEAELDPADVLPFGEWVDDHGGWTYTTIVARGPRTLELAPANAESTAIRWWAIDEVAALPLHAGFAASWPSLRELIGSAASLP